MLTCRRYKGSPYDYREACQLPEILVNFDFICTAIRIDYVEPVFIKNVYSENDKNIYKSRIVL